MMGKYGGILPDNSPIYRFLAGEVLGRVLGFDGHRPVFDIFHLDNSMTALRYADRVTFVNVVGKFYGNKWIHGKQTGEPELRVELMHREFDNLRRVRALGLDTYPHCVVRPLAVCEELDCMLVEEFVPGTDLDFYVREAVRWGKEDECRAKLRDVAWFLADLHSRSQTHDRVDGACGLSYMDKIIRQLAYWKIISDDRRKRFLELRDRWAACHVLDVGQQVLMHGDAILPHFLCSGEHGITAIDLERLRPGDRATDIGCIVAELKHLFFLYSHNIWASEPYIQHFYDSYIGYLPEELEDSQVLTTRGRFYMGCYQLRISRNSWLDLDYRRALIHEAEACLEI